jgi:serine/threonine-protein kinase
MGSVYVAEQLATARLVALKVLAAVPRERFELECKAAAWARSEHIVEVLDAGYDDSTGLPFIVMELLEGESLRELVEREGPQAPERVLSFLEQTARGLDRAHGYRDAQGRSKPIVHRDLKPENVFLARTENREPMIKILDFGIAKVVSDTNSISRDICGSPLYISYEQLMGHAVSPPTDVWALGLIAFFLLTGRSYWLSAANPEAGSAALFAEIMHGSYDSASVRARVLDVQPSWPPAFDAWFARTVSRSVTTRFGSAGQAVAALRDVFSEVNPAVAGAFDRTVTAPQFAVVGTSPESARPSRLWVPLALGAAIVMGVFALRGQRPPAAETAPPLATASASAPVLAVSAAAPEASAASVAVQSSTSTVSTAPRARALVVGKVAPTIRTPVISSVSPPQSTPEVAPDDPFGSR